MRYCVQQQGRNPYSRLYAVAFLKFRTKMKLKEIQIASIVITVNFCFKLSTSKSHCVGTCYSGQLFPEPEVVFYGKHLKGYSYNNITTHDPSKCYHQCVQDCRCKACQMKDGTCELLDEDKTSKADDFITETGYEYFDLKQTMYKGQSHMVPPGDCYNGCCRSQPCLNGGTCVEHCKSPKEKFICKCTELYIGKICDIHVSSCTDIMIGSSALPKDGVYTIKRSDAGNKFQIYCSFLKNPRQAWALIESFSFGKNLFKLVPFYNETTANESAPPSWDLYRIGHGKMMYLRSKSALFRATCDFEKRTSLTPDLLIGWLREVDIINVQSISGCKKYKFIDIRGHNCTNCTANTGASSSYHFHIDVTHASNGCEFNPPSTVNDVDSFGFYGTTDQISKCTVMSNSTTQWWLGDEI